MKRLTACLIVAASIHVIGCGDGDDTIAETPVNGKIAFVSERDGNSEIYAVSADGSGVLNLTNSPSNEPAGPEDDGADFDWSPDGTRIVFTSDRDDGNPEIYVVNVDGSDQRRLTRTPDASESYPRWSPDGSQIVFVKSGPYGPNATKHIYVMNADGSNAIRLTQGESWAEEPAWSPDGQQIAFEAGGIFVMNADGLNRRAVVDTEDDYYAPTWSPDGSRIAFHSYRDSTKEDDPGMYQQIFVVDPDGSDLIHVPEGANDDDYYAMPSWSPDSQRLVFFSDEDPGSNLHVMDADGSNVSRLTDTGALIGVWSPDSDQIAAVMFEGSSQTNLTAALYVMGSDGSDQRMLTDEITGFFVVWSPIP